jgi:hypothetical protein
VPALEDHKAGLVGPASFFVELAVDVSTVNIERQIRNAES